MPERPDTPPPQAAVPALPAVDYRQVFDHAPALLLLLAPDAPRFTILGASDAYLRATQTQREAIAGRGLFEVFRDNPADPQATGTANLRASLETVLATRAPHTMAVQKYDVRRPSGGFVERYWSPVNSPALDANGRVGYLIHRVEDVTDLVLATLAIQRDGHSSGSPADPAALPDVRNAARLTGDTHERFREILAHHAAALQAAVREKESLQRLHEAVVSATPDLIYVFDLNHRFTYANKALLAMWGKTWEEAIGRNCLELGYEPWHAAMHDRELDEVVATKRSIRGEVAFHGTNGRRFYDYILSPVLGANGDVEAVAGTTRDVTEQHGTAADARFVADLMQRLIPLEIESEIIRQAVTAVGQHFRAHRCYFMECLESRNLMRVSENWVRDQSASLAGELTLYDFGGPTWWRQFSAGDFAVEDVTRHPLIDPESARNYVSRDISSYAVQPIKRTGEWTVVLAITENTPRVWTAHELRLLDHVAARVWPLVERVRAETQLRAARDEALAASRAKDDFLAVLSHELRTPLNPVLLVASESANDPALAEEVRGDFKMISDNISLQARLIDDLLDFNRIIHGKVTLEKRELDLHEVVRDATATLQEEIAAKQIGLTFALHARIHTVQGDPVRLRQVFWNLLKNAVKFTPAGGRIEISSPEGPRAGGIELRIRDTGIGMNSGELAQIFHPFVQGEHASDGHRESFGGLGLGLAISRTLVELHGGTLSAESGGTGHGATIIVRLPLKAAAGRRAKPADHNGSTPANGNGHRTQRILFVEDHEPTRTAMTRLLKRRGYEVSIAHSVQAGLEQARDSLFDVLISDLGLPDGDGCELMVELKKKQPDIRGIALSGYGMDGDLTRSRDAGFSDHLIKPVSVDSLDRAMTRLLERNGAPAK
jgi:PAS domain S-box-containing protein